MNKIVGKVLELFVSDSKESNRIKKDKIYFNFDGIKEDKFYNKDSNRSVLLSSIVSYSLASKHNINIDYGLLGENILIDYNPYLLAIGEQLKIGEVIVEITQACTICSHLGVIHSNLPTLLKDDRGIFVKVIKEGMIQIGSNVSVL